MRALLAVCAACSFALMLQGCSSSPGRPESNGAYVEEGVASYYAEEFNGRKTSNGETYNMHDMTAAHRTLPFGTRVRVINLITGKSLIVRINDRGPFTKDRVIDLSYDAAKKLELVGSGTSRVRIEVVSLGERRKK
jgi:rare lipoprotein A